MKKLRTSHRAEELILIKKQFRYLFIYFPEP